MFYVDCKIANHNDQTMFELRQIARRAFVIKDRLIFGPFFVAVGLLPQGDLITNVALDDAPRRFRSCFRISNLLT